MRGGFAVLFSRGAFAGQDVAALLQRFVAAQKANDARACQYTYSEHATFFTYTDGGGNLRKDRTEDSEVLFIEGLQFKRLISHNGQPLSAREAAEVSKQMKETADYRRKHLRPVAPGGAISFGGDHADLGSDEELLTLFSNQLVGEDELRGRKAWVIESTPKEGLPAADQHTREVLHFRKKLWLDQGDNTLLRIVHTVVVGGVFAKPGTTVAIDYEKLPDGVYQPTAVVVDIYRQVGKVVRPSGRTEYSDSDFHKFDVQSTITLGEPH